MDEAAFQTKFQVRLQAVQDRLASEKIAAAYRVLIPATPMPPDDLKPSPYYESDDRNLCPSLLAATEGGEDHWEPDQRAQ